MAELDGKEFEDIFKTLLPDDLIRGLSKRLGVVERERELDVVMFTRAMVIGGQSHEGGRQADMLRAYVVSTGTEPARSGFYRKFDKETDTFTAASSITRCLVPAMSQPFFQASWLV